MRLTLRIIAVCSIAAATVTNAQLLPYLNKPFQPKRPVTMDQVAQPGPSIQGQPTGNIVLSDVLGSQRSISIFASFTRDVSSIASRLESQSSNTTLLAPLNSAISALPRKPWEDPEDYAKLGEQAYLGDGGSQRAEKNLERFVGAHVVPMSPWQADSKVKTLAGQEIWYEMQDGDMLIMPGRILVEQIAKRVGNGEVWILKGVVNYSS